MKSRLAIFCWLLAVVAGPATRARAQDIIVRRNAAPLKALLPSTARDAKSDGTEAAAPTATLQWNNGESLIGEPIGATNETLSWKSPYFDDPLVLNWTSLHRVDKVQPDREPTDAFAFVLRDGSRIYGNLLHVDETTLGIRSTRHGDVVLNRAEVLSARRIKSTRLIYGGPFGESGWTPAPGIRMDEDRSQETETMGKVPTRVTGPGGTLVLPFWHRAVSNPVILPDRAEVEFELHSKDQPAFQLALEGREKKSLRVETWGSQAVLVSGKNFEKICDLAPTDRRVALRIFWDRPAHQCRVYTPGGALLKEWTVPDGNDGSKPAIVLANKGRELTLDLLCVREWDGQPPAVTDPAQPHVELDNGRAVDGSVQSVNDGQIAVAPVGEGPAANVALEDVDAIIFAHTAPWENLRETTLSCADGTFLRGQIAGYQNGRALLQTTFTQAPLPVALDDLRHFFIRAAVAPGTPAEPPLESLDKLAVQSTILHGQLVATTGGKGPQWLPVGGQAPCTPSSAADIQITRVSPGEPGEFAATNLLYTRMGDALPGVLHNVDRQEVDFDSPWIEAKKLPVGEFAAIQFEEGGKGAIKSFDGPGWQIVKGDKAEIQASGNKLKLPPDAIVGHPTAAQEGEINFTYDTENYSCLRLRLFCDGMKPNRALNYIIMRSGNRVSSGVESTEGQFSNQRQSTMSTGPVAVRLVIDEKSVRVYLADKLAETVWYPGIRRAGAGLILEASSVWGNSPQQVALSGFSANSPSGRSFVLGVNPDAKAQALTIPRFRKDDPPHHALLANNGDVLRGEIVALTTTQIGFRIGLETLRIPRDRVAAIVALQAPSANAAQPPEPDPIQKLLEHHIGLNTWYGGIGYNTVLNVVRQNVPELKFQAPGNDQDTLRVQFHFENQTVGELLDGVCEQFDLRYHVEKGVFIFEKRTGKAELNLVRKVYWLRTDPFVGKGAAADILAARDVPFPRGTSVEWQAGARCLEVTNTAANQQKIAALLTSDFGGTFGSPTLWLMLRNGGRIGLNVEKFEPDAITGTHPIYGRCRIPLADVYAIRNTLPEPTATARALDGWKLAYAPEPVLPQSGGENSELLGKDAPTFKLKMLAGEDFDLTQEKGKVVVLDFWATWCGPCIKSLPGLIDATAQFPADKVKLVGVNQAEAPEQIRRFLEGHGWKLAVALDAGQAVARKYGVDGIPHTVIVGPDGKIAWVQTGATADGDERAAEVIRKLLGQGAAPGEKPKPKPTDAPTPRPPDNV